ncbi:DNA-binding transcriptional LysR family regulator [Nocardioides albertanoniae]|uniref:DNA-binding transcriptional LysR family regulator n=1 Tax=Nocardioides albertanoniae TaxID=1175486 RepID=A0A543A8F5_9ACTN|nr:LysR family transcriptional regulator [Nocardioides albertanoniae]TQL68776.1 DNA-binding transcriptional LysR family regulator [Nocardioides albertanoniae]
MERRQLEFFLAISEAGSFTSAAARLHVAQPSLSYAVRGLERELGGALFERHGRGVRLTPAGSALIGPARRVVRGFELAAGAVRSISDEGFGRLRITSSTVWAVEPLVPLLAEFRRIQPGAHVVVGDPQHRSDVLDQVRKAEADVGLIDGAPPRGPFASHHLVEHELVAVLPPSPEGPEEVGIEELAEIGLIATPGGTALRTYLDARLEAAGLPTEVAIETAHVASITPLVLARAGAAVLTEGMAGAASRAGARVVPLSAGVRVNVSLVWLPDRGDALVEQFVELAQDANGV